MSNLVIVFCLVAAFKTLGKPIDDWDVFCLVLISTGMDFIALTKKEKENKP